MRVKALTLALLFLAPLATPAHAQTSNSGSQSDDGEGPDCSSPHLGSLNIEANREGFESREVSFCYEAGREVEIREGLPAVLGCPPGKMEFSLYKDEGLEGLDASCELLLDRRGFKFTGQVELAPIQTLLKGAGVDEIAVSVLVPSYGGSRCDIPATGENTSQTLNNCSFSLTGAPGEPRAIRFSYGYDSTGIARIVGILGILLISPILAMLWLRRRARGASEESKPTIVFSYVRILRWTAMGGVLVWWAAIDLLRADAFLGFLVPANLIGDPAIASIVPWILLWFLAAAAYFLCLALSTPIQSLRGATRTGRQALRQSFWTVARFVLPMSLAALGFGELAGHAGTSVLLFMGAFFAWAIAKRMGARAFGIELHALTSGELRDRTFEIAGKAGAKLNQLYVFPAETLRLASAYAHSANMIFLTDYLVKNLSKREVDAVIGHEMTHLRKRHAYIRQFVLMGGMLALVAAESNSEQFTPPWIPLGPLVYGLVLLVLFFVSRQNEFTADAGSVKLTGDAEAMMTALARISRLNTMPIHWGKLDEKTLTHPSTMRRIRRLARAGGISEARIPELLNLSSVRPAEIYSIPANIALSGKLFSTRFKARQNSFASWTMILTIASVPAAVALLLEWANVSGAALSFAYLAGTLLTIGCGLLLANSVPMSGALKLERRLRDKFEKDGAPPAICDGLFVSLAPDSGPRIYEGNWAWDLGFLAATDERLYYWGEETRFSLPRAGISRVSLGSGPVGWFGTPSVYVLWRDESGQEHTFNLRAFRARSMLEMRRQTRRLCLDLEGWHKGTPSAASELPSVGRTEFGLADAIGAPSVGAVTSVSPRTVVRGRLARIFLSDTIIAAGVALVFRLQSPIFEGAFPPSGSANPDPFIYVLATVWITRAILLLPYWRFREKTSPPVPATPPAPSK